MNIKRICFFILLICIFPAYAYAVTKFKCIHTVYSTAYPDVYHYGYCSICGKCNSAVAHSYSYSYYNSYYDRATCYCGYSKLVSHSLYAVKISKGETVCGKTFTSTDDLDEYHKLVCAQCGYTLGTAKHNWGGGDIFAHKCINCSYVHSKQNDATKGRHYFNISQITSAGSVASCVVCNRSLILSYENGSVLKKLPGKEEYTMVGNPNPMKEVSISDDVKIKTNFMPINEERRIN